MTKHELIESAYNVFSQSGDYEKVLTDVPFEEETIDMVLVGKDQKLTTIGFTPTNWRSALRKARSHALGADFTSLCLPAKKWPTELKLSAAEQGIGVMLVYPLTGKIEPLVKSFTGAMWREAREKILTEVKTGEL